jgi:hypothetical protein
VTITCSRSSRIADRISAEDTGDTVNVVPKGEEREYEIEFLEHKVKTQIYPGTGNRHAAWDVVARKS